MGPLLPAATIHALPPSGSAFDGRTCADSEDQEAGIPRPRNARSTAVFSGSHARSSVSGAEWGRIKARKVFLRD